MSHEIPCLTPESRVLGRSHSMVLCSFRHLWTPFTWYGLVRSTGDPIASVVHRGGWPSAAALSLCESSYTAPTSFRLSHISGFRCPVIAGHHCMLGGWSKSTPCLCCILSVAGKYGPESFCTFYISRHPSGQVFVSWVRWGWCAAFSFCSFWSRVQRWRHRVCGQLPGRCTAPCMAIALRQRRQRHGKASSVILHFLPPNLK